MAETADRETISIPGQVAVANIGPMSSEDTHLGPYLGVVGRVIEMVQAAEPDQLDAMVPACPDWSALQVVSHLAALAEDWVSGNLDGYATDVWTQAQADRFVNRPLDELVEAWTAAVGRFGELGPSPLGATPARWTFGDGVTHEADLRPVLAAGTRVPADAVAFGLQAAIGRWRLGLANAGVAPLDVVATDLRSWQVGDPDARTGEPVATVSTTAYELFRALYGRRSRAQMEAWDWSGDSAPYLDLDLAFPFSYPVTDLRD